MKKEDLIEAMQGIDAKDLEDSEKGTAKRYQYRSLKMLAACACAVMIIGAIYSIGLLRTGQAVLEESKESNQIVDEETEAQLINPMEESDIDGILQDWGAKLKSPEGASHVTEYVIHIGSTEDILERRFVYDTINYTARVQRTENFQDISGMYYSWNTEEECQVNEYSGKTMRYISEDGQEQAALCLWYDQEHRLMYSLAADGEGAAKADIVAVASMMQE